MYKGAKTIEIMAEINRGLDFWEGDHLGDSTGPLVAIGMDGSHYERCVGLYEGRGQDDMHVCSLACLHAHAIVEVLQLRRLLSSHHFSKDFLLDRLARRQSWRYRDQRGYFPSCDIRRYRCLIPHLHLGSHLVHLDAVFPFCGERIDHLFAPFRSDVGHSRRADLGGA